MSECFKWGEETREECAEYRDDGYNKCSEYRDDGYHKCSQWDAKCCTWWPCSWLCKLITWICKGWYWVTNLVCVAWYWVANLVCVAWTVVTSVVCLVWVGIAVVVGFIIDVVSVVLGPILGLIDYLIEVFFSIPFLGRILRQLFEVITEVIYRGLGLLDALAWVVGIRPQKKLRMCVIILKDEEGNPVADTSAVLEEVQAAADIFDTEANVSLIPVSIFHAASSLHKKQKTDESFIHIDDSPSEAKILDLTCGMGAWVDDLGLIGSRFNIIMSRVCFWGNARRLLGYGASVTVFVVRGIENAAGCSLGPLVSYITVVGTETEDKTTIAHETGHVCGLWDVDSPTDNLMYESIADDTRDMNLLQTTIFRNSKYVTYF